MGEETPYFARLAAAYVRGKLGSARRDALFTTPLDALTGAQWEAVIREGQEAGLRLHRFKRTMELPRVRRVLGVLRGLQPASLLDVGSGRGAFLWPLLDAFPSLPVTAVDVLAHRVADILAVRDGGVGTLDAVRADATALPFTGGAFDVATALEVLEHISDAERALAEACRAARRFVVLSAPSHPDDNPEHIHLFDKAAITAMLERHGADRVQVEYVPGHLIAVARLARG
jgi:ubiquinone/menaquinone biosynthesis C-methylase UbiE